MAMGTVVSTADIRLIAGALLLVWAAYHWLYGHRHRVRVGMTVGVMGLALWSFLMATAHGAGLMLVPALMPLCAMPTIGGGVGIGSGSLMVSLAAVAVHTVAMLAVTGLIALVVHEWVGLAFLRRSWINFDHAVDGRTGHHRPGAHRYGLRRSVRRCRERAGMGGRTTGPMRDAPWLSSAPRRGRDKPPAAEFVSRATDPTPADSHRLRR